MVKKIASVLPVLLCVSLIGLTGCSKKAATDEAVKVQAPEAMGAEESLESKSLGISEGRTTEGMLPVYFNFDASDIRTDQVSRIQVNADFIKNNSKYAQIRIEGNCDERGTNEYNMALGERRALSAKKYLINLGVTEDRLTTVSYGEERVLLHGHDELSWAQNRRDDFVVVE